MCTEHKRDQRLNSRYMSTDCITHIGYELTISIIQYHISLAIEYKAYSAIYADLNTVVQSAYHVVG